MYIMLLNNTENVILIKDLNKNITYRFHSSLYYKINKE